MTDPTNINIQVEGLDFYPAALYDASHQITLLQKRKKALPLLEAMLANDELHNPFVTMQHIRAWAHVSEVMARHGWVWDGYNWNRSERDRAISNTYRYRPGKACPAIWQPQMYSPETLYGRALSTAHSHLFTPISIPLKGGIPHVNHQKPA